MRIAVIGAGVSGLGASWALSRRHDVTLFEQDGRPGGHANTVVAGLHGRPVPVDTGFIVYNTVNYPHLTRLFELLGVVSVESDMSFAVSLDGGRWEMAGRPSGLFGTPRQVLSPVHWGLLADTARFFRSAETALDDERAASEGLGTWLRRHGYRAAFIDRFLVPMAAAIWSSSAADILDYPVRPFVSFFRNHGLLKFSGRVRWRTVEGGSASYVRRVAATMPAVVRLGEQVVAVRPGSGGCSVELGGGRHESFDEVVLACHGDQARRLLGEADDRERRELLETFRYSTNEAVLHRDATLMPRRRRLWSSWNYTSEADGTGMAAVTYWMNRLQALETTEQVFVTLNPRRQPDATKVLARLSYEHPQFDHATFAAQRRLGDLQGRGGVWLCGSYTGFGFHEDGLRSGLQVAAALGAPVPWWGEDDARAAPWTTTAVAARPALAA